MFFKKLLSSLFSPLKKYQGIVGTINELEPEYKDLSNEELKNKSLEIKKAVSENQKTLDEILPQAFAIVREAAKRTLGQRHFDVQLIGGAVLHEGKIAEMVTGEGKTLTATLAVYLNALAGKGVHIMTVNDYLARRDAVWMGQIYYALGLSTSCLAHEQTFIYDPAYTQKIEEAKIENQNFNSDNKIDKKDKERDILGGFKIIQEFLRPVSRKEAYSADITYGTNHEFGFDYLRDNLVYGINDQVQRNHNFVIVDEVDSILIDEARTPLIIAAPDAESSNYYKIFAKIVRRLLPKEDYLTDEKDKAVDLTQQGIEKIEDVLKLKNLFDPENLRLVHYLRENLKAEALFKKDKDYIVKNGEIVIVDEFTGRLMYGRRYSGGLHQAIEAKENLDVKNESRTFAQISIQNYVRLYDKIAGMTGTAQTSAEEFDKVYKLEVVSIPTNKQLIRKNLPDKIYKTRDAKLAAIVNEIKERHEKGQPVLVGTISIEKNEELSRLLRLNNIPHQILNAKNHEEEGSTIAQAGQFKAVTIATNMAGRGVDIVLGGNPPNPTDAQRVKDLEGLHVIGTERHESRRIDNQLRGRSGRQGDPGGSRFFLSLEDDLLRIFGAERLKNMMTALNVPEDIPIESKLISKLISDAQAKVEGLNFDARKHLLEYDDVLNKQRQTFYKMRQDMLAKDKPTLLLAAFDQFWMNHLEDMDNLADSVRLRAYGQRDPLVEYKHEGRLIFQQMLQNFEAWQKENEERTKGQSSQMQKPDTSPKSNPYANQKIGRNDPCPCNSGKKYKKCHGR